MFQNTKVRMAVVAALALVALVPVTAFAAETSAPEAAGSGYDVGALTDAEAEGLLYMREEEKLAHDVYLTLYEQWGLQLFQNIAGSEQVHTETVLSLLECYGLADPALGLGVGEFANADLQALYGQLVAQGSASLADALRVGAAIEEIDIRDLDTYLATTTATDIRQAYENLRAGSYSHLRAFVSTLEGQTGEVYQPQYLALADYEAIMAGQNGGAQGGFGQSAQGTGAQGAMGQGVNGGGQGYGQGAQGANGRGRGAGGRGRGAQGGQNGQSGQGGFGQAQQTPLYSQSGTGTCLQY